MSRLLRLTSTFLRAACVTAFLAGCEGQLPSQFPSLEQGMKALDIGSKIYNRPKFTEADEERMAQENAAKFEKQNKIWDDPLLDTYLGDIIQRLVAVAHPRPFTYRIRVVNDSSINAFTFGGGLLYVNAGLLARMENEAQLAMVLGHELAHVTESHVTKGIEGAYGIQLLGELAAEGATASGKVSLPPALLQKTYEYSMTAAISGHGRASESEADVVGLEYLVKAGYDPREAPRTFEQLLKEYGDQTRLQNFFYGDHPTNKARIEKLTDLTKSKYSKDLETRKLLVNTTEFKQRVRELVVATAKLDYEGKRFNTAAAMFEKAVQTDDKDPIAHYYLGKIALETASGAESVQRATVHLASAIKANDTYAPAYRELGMAFYRLKDKPKAIEAFQLYLKLDPRAKDADRIRKSIEDLQRE